jgi:hypothetical protein
MCPSDAAYTLGGPAAAWRRSARRPRSLRDWAAPPRAGLDMLRLPIHGSGNPVPWDTERGDGHREWLGMLHAKRGDYAHWAVRIDRATRRVTHVSAGPVVKARDYRNEVRPPRTCRPPVAAGPACGVCRAHARGWPHMRASGPAWCG